MYWKGCLSWRCSVSSFCYFAISLKFSPFWHCLTLVCFLDGLHCYNLFASKSWCGGFHSKEVISFFGLSVYIWNRKSCHFKIITPLLSCRYKTYAYCILRRSISWRDYWAQCYQWTKCARNPHPHCHYPVDQISSTWSWEMFHQPTETCPLYLCHLGRSKSPVIKLENLLMWWLGLAIDIKMIMFVLHLRVWMQGVYMARGGGGALPYWRCRGRAAGQGMILRSSRLKQGV